MSVGPVGPGSSMGSGPFHAMKAPRVWGVAAVASMAIHLAAMGVHWPFGSASSGSGPSPVVFATRTVAAPTRPTAEVGTEVASPVPESPVLPSPDVPSVPERAIVSSAETPAPVVVRPPSSAPASASAMPETVMPAHGASTPVADPAAYAASIGLSPPPRPLGPVDPVIPPAAGTRGGSVVLKVFVNERGGVDRVEVVSSDPPGVFDASAVAAFGSVAYSPGLLAGVPVKAWVTFEISYPSASTGAPAGSRTY